MAWDQKIQIKRCPRMPQGSYRVPSDHQTWKIFFMHQICNCIQQALHVQNMTDPQGFASIGLCCLNVPLLISCHAGQSLKTTAVARVSAIWVMPLESLLLVFFISIRLLFYESGQ
jgi:hypothetical protein